MLSATFPARALAALALAALALAATAIPAGAAKGGRWCRSCSTTTGDTTAPTASITSPTSGATVSGTVSVKGTASDNVGLSRVDVSVDGAAYQPATGTSSWSYSWSTAGLSSGSHTLTARAVDTAGNASASAVTVYVANPAPDTTPPSVAISTPVQNATVRSTVSVTGTASDDVGLSRVAVSIDGAAYQPATGASSWSFSWNSTGVADGAHTLSARATDTSGNVRTTSVTVTVDNTPDPAPAPSPAPDTQGSWTSPEGVRINVTTAGPFTIKRVYTMLLENALDLDRIGPSLTVNVQDQTTSMTQTGTGMTNGVYDSLRATIYLKGVNSTFAAYPDWVLAHEYGHAWTMYFLYVERQNDWSSYLSSRWSTADGSRTLATDSRLDSGYSWDRGEIIADDYRLLFGSSAARAQQPSHLNTSIPHPANVPGLRDFLLGAWRA